MIFAEWARRFAEDWIESWNAHDLDRIMSHYTDDFEMTTPFIAQVMNEPSGSLKGRENVRAYWAMALARIPDLRFELVDVLIGVRTITLYYQAPYDRRAAEVFFFNSKGLVERSIAHYDEI